MTRMRDLLKEVIDSIPVTHGHGTKYGSPTCCYFCNFCVAPSHFWDSEIVHKSNCLVFRIQEKLDE